MPHAKACIGIGCYAVNANVAEGRCSIRYHDTKVPRALLICVKAKIYIKVVLKFTVAMQALSTV